MKRVPSLRNSECGCCWACRGPCDTTRGAQASVPPIPHFLTPATQRNSGRSPAPGSLSELLGVSGHLKNESRKQKGDFSGGCRTWDLRVFRFQIHGPNPSEPEKTSAQMQESRGEPCLLRSKEQQDRVALWVLTHCPRPVPGRNPQN